MSHLRSHLNMAEKGLYLMKYFNMLFELYNFTVMLEFHG